MTTLLREAYQSMRSLARRPGLAVTIVLTVVLGIGSTTAIFSIVDAMFLRPLALKSPDRLILIEESKKGKPSNGNPLRLADWRSQVPGLESATGFYSEKLVLTGRGDAERVRALRTFGSIFAVLGVEPQIGRAFSAREEAGEPVVLLSDGYWHRRFGGDAAMLGQTLELDGKPHTIVGILPRQFTYPERVDVLVPAPVEIQHASRKASFLPTIARMKSGVRLAEVQTQLATVAERLRGLYPATDKDLSARAVPLQASDADEAAAPVLAVMGTVTLVLLTACINVAGLLLARAAERQREASIRVSLGAGRVSLIRLYLLESGLLAAAGCVVGLAFAAFGLQGLKAILPSDLPRMEAAAIDGRVMLFAVLLSLLCAVAFGIGPAWQSARAAMGSSQRPRDARAFFVRRALVAGQVALSLVLLIGAGLLGESFLRMQKKPLGFTPANVLTVNISFPWDAPNTRVEAFREQALDGFSAIPGVISAGWGDRLPMSGGTQSGPIGIRNRQLPPGLSEASTYHRAASETYFQAIGIPLKLGRIFKSGRHEAVVNETLAKKFFPDGGAIGSFLTFDPAPKPGRPQQWLEIVGITGDVRQASAEMIAPAEVYVSGQDLAWPLSSFVLRIQGDANSTIPAVREAVRRIAPNQVIDSIGTMEGRMDEAFREPKLESWLVFGFAMTALGLTVLGIYGVMSSDVIQRTREIGVRIAVGARPGEVLAMMVRRGLLTVIPGILLGILGAAAMSRLLSRLLVGVDPLDGFVFGAAPILLIMIGLAASYLPARRAAKTDPVIALRQDS